MTANIHYSELWGEREAKYGQLLRADARALEWRIPIPQSPFYFFTELNTDLHGEYDHGWEMRRIFPVNNTGVITSRDHFVKDVDLAALQERVEDFRDLPFEKAQAKYGLGDVRERTLLESWKMLRGLKHIREYMKQALWQPFDLRYLFYHHSLVRWPVYAVMHHMLAGRNLGLCTTRSIEIGRGWEHVLCTSNLIQHHTVSNKEVNYLFPLFLYEDTKDKLLRDAPRRPNIAPRFIDTIAQRLDLAFNTDPAHNKQNSFCAEDVLYYIYSVFHSPTYRSRYAEYLKMDFPRVPLTSDAELFCRLRLLGADLVALHLLEDDYEAASWNTSQPKGRSPLKTFITRLTGKDNTEVAKGYPKYKDGSIWINPSAYFEGAREEVWNFHIGGYQVCEKWLKDRRGRTLSDEDISHYQRVVVALNETIRLMGEIDAVIEEHGGWPLVGSQDAPKPSEPDQLPFS